MSRAAPCVVAAAAVVVAALAAWTPTTSSGFVAKIQNSVDTASTDNYFQCSVVTGSAVDGANALFVWPLTEGAGATTAADGSGKGNTGTYQGTLASDTATPPVKACPRDSGSPLKFDGASTFAYLGTQQSDPTTFSLEVWFKTSTASGKLIGFGSAKTGASGSYDRHLYVNTAGQLVFGTYNGGVQIVKSTASVTDGAWHHAVATLAPSGAWVGMRLYVDGALVASNSAYTTPQNFAGYWRVGYDSLSGWTGAGSDNWFTGDLRYAAVYSTALSPTQVQQHYGAGAGS